MDDATRRWHLHMGWKAGRESACGSKIDYKSEARAAQTASRLNAQGDRRSVLEAYPCYWCEGWHIGRKMEGIYTPATMLESPPYTVFRTYLYNSPMVLAYQSPNGMWWSSWKLGVTDLGELCEFVAFSQPDDWPGWEILRAEGEWQA